jgi:hypothetical protein
MARLALYLLGPPRIQRDGQPVEVRRRKAVALLAYLAVTAQGHSRDALATLFWPEHDQSRARAGLRRTLASLKKGLGEGWLEVDRENVGLNSNTELWLDVEAFQDRLAACGTHGHPAQEMCPDCLPLLAEAVELYCDDFLAGFTLRDSGPTSGPPPCASTPNASGFSRRNWVSPLRTRQPSYTRPSKITGKEHRPSHSQNGIGWRES